ncbi:MAG: thymidine phosphorylase [Geminicoccaceae bacterium]
MTANDAAMPLLPQEVIRKKRDGRALDAGEIEAFVAGLTRGEVTEGQGAAFAMAVFFNGMQSEETVALTLAMRDSGKTLSWKDLDGPVLDKHSTGGIGDKVSLILAPLIAAIGGYVPMISGRGLGHTGGTLDKLDSIPGYNTRIALERLRFAVREVGCAIVGQTAELAPADGRLYAIRDVTATVDIPPMIVASILSKKLAAGLSGLVMDVKVGSGAFLPSMEDARSLARDLVTVAEGAGLPCRAVLTDMNQCLGRNAGNALEVCEVLDLLTERDALSVKSREPRLAAVTLTLAARLAELGGLADSPDEAKAMLIKALEEGRAAERFQKMVAALGGPGDLIDRPEKHLPKAPVQRPAILDREGCIAAIDTRALGLAIIELGGGRTRPDDCIDPRVGFSDVLGIGEKIEKNRPFALVHAASEADAERAIGRLRAAITLTEGVPTSRTEPVFEEIGVPA